MRDITDRIIALDPSEGHPAEYMASRASGRRGRMVRQWGALLFSEKFQMPEHYELEGPVAVRTVDVPWAVFFRWLRRIYNEMGSGMREDFAPVLAFHELGTLFSALRFKAREDSAEPVSRLLLPSAIEPRLKTALIEAPIQAEAVIHIQKALLGLLPDTKTALTPHALEATCTSAYLHLACNSPRLHPDIRLYFQYLASMRNIIIVHKHLRWAELLEAPLLEGKAGLIESGLIDYRRIRRAASPEALIGLVELLTGGLRPRSIANIEGLMLSGLLRTMRLRAHTSATPEAIVMDAIVRAYTEARNLSLIAATRDLDRAIVKEEIAE